MKTHHTLRTMLYAAAACLAVAAAGALSSSAHADVRIDSTRHHHHSSDIGLDGDDVLIIAHDRSEARITPSGQLYIKGRSVSVSDGQRKLLQQYNAGIHDIETRGLEIGKSAIDLVGGMLGTLVTEALAGEDDDTIEDHVRSRTGPIKEQARQLCKVAHAERSLQDQIALQIPSFQPYAVMEDDDDSDNDCHIDDREV